MSKEMNQPNQFGGVLHFVRERASLLIVGMFVLWLITPFIAFSLNDYMPRDQLEPAKITIGAAALLGLSTAVVMISCALASVFVAMIARDTLSRWFKVLAVFPCVAIVVFWLGLVIFEGM